MLPFKTVERVPDSLFGELRVCNTCDAGGRPVRLLLVDGSWQSATYVGDPWPELVFSYHKTFCMAFAQELPAQIRCLMLGGGGYGFPSYLLCRRSDVWLDVVEADPVVIDLARRHFGLDRVERMLAREAGPSRLRSLICDARDFLELGAPDDPQVRYDLIFNDCFARDSTPASLLTREAALLLRARLRPGGAYLANVVSALEGPRSQLVRDVRCTLLTAFERVWVIPCEAGDRRREDNLVVVASDAPLLLGETYDLDGPGSFRAPEGRVLFDLNAAAGTSSLFDHAAPPPEADMADGAAILRREHP
ncbi:spermidine synthase [Olsenella sp. HMSC062G07]|uniref:spermidine synthase n=1 Tax=Olsenella sp. HMSC062G07 TaxID=1739330 RepID=UPI0008A37AA3|nr:fused MFS/spermidine synthase [Olsenella sp. HMSC062G07]OFK23398.1 hypothetical protein HMPREF2826_04765 [Olsenella sp. HMSC062G07]